MSTVLTIRIWTDDDSARVGDRANELVEVVERWTRAAEPWRAIRIHDGDAAHDVRQANETSHRNEVAGVLAGRRGAMLRVSLRTAVECWRFQGLTPSKGFVPLWLESWGRDHAGSGGRDYEIEGDAALTLGSAGPYCAMQSPVPSPDIDRVNEHVEENLERLLALLLDVASTLRPTAMKVFTDQGVYQPLNAHAIFFRDAEALLRDVRLLDRLWNQGLPGYQTAALHESRTTLDREMLHTWRDEAKQRALIEGLARVIHRARDVTAADVERIDWARFDNYEGDAGRLVLDYPHFVNSFVDDFYLELLEGTGQA